MSLKELASKYETKINDLKSELASIASKQEIKEEKVRSAHEIEVSELKRKYDELERIMKQSIENEKLKLQQQYEVNINNLNNMIKLQEANNVANLQKANDKHLNEVQELKIKHQEELALKEKTINEKEMLYNQLKNEKSVMNIKNIGESLETWCDNEITSHMQNGLFNCTWGKDNEVVKNEGESKGSKADYIFKVYATEEHKPEELLASVCLDMKDENPDSKNTKKNSDHYKALDNNRNKKGCKYAVLVSNLELKSNNDVPIRRVTEYPDMYVIRPAYMVSFLGMINSLSMKFKDLLLCQIKDKLEVKNRQELLDQFEALKNTYFNKMLDSLTTQVENIMKHNDSIIKAADAIKVCCDNITRNYIDNFHAKLERFEIGLNKAYKTYENTL